jgi:glycosyltransferase involved in cell wall biosynthesis
MRTRPRILVVSPYPPTPPFAGGRRRIHELVNFLCGVASVTLASVTFSRKDELAVADLFGSSSELLLARPTRDVWPADLPPAFGWAWSSGLAELIAHRHRDAPFDVAIAGHSFSFPFVARLPQVQKVLDAHNLEYRLHAQFAQLPFSDRHRLLAFAGDGGAGYDESDPAEERAFEQAAWAAADVVLCVSEIERSEVAASPGSPRTLVVPNGCVSARASSSLIAPQRPTISFAGALNYIPNIDAVLGLVDEVMPLVRHAVPAVELLVAGREPTPALVQYCRQRSASVVANPDDMFATLAGTVMAVPLRLGAGTRIKVLEARSNGLPVIASSIAVEGLEARYDPGLVISDRPEAMARDLVERLLVPQAPAPARVCPPAWDEVFLPLLDEIGVSR